MTDELFGAVRHGQHNRTNLGFEINNHVVVAGGSMGRVVLLR